MTRFGKDNRATALRLVNRYMHRRQAIREEYRDKGGWWGNLEYKKRTKKMTKRIGSWNQVIKNIDLRKVKIDTLGNKIEAFFGVTIRNTGGSKRSDVTALARKVFYKYGIEHNIAGSELQVYTGSVRKGLASVVRREFTRSFKDNLENRETYHRFAAFCM